MCRCMYPLSLKTPAKQNTLFEEGIKFASRKNNDICKQELSVADTWLNYNNIQNTLSLNQQQYILYTGNTQNNGAVSKVNKKFISHLTRAQRTPSAAAAVQVSHALPAVRFSCLMRGQFPRWRRSRKRLSVFFVLRCTDM